MTPTHSEAVRKWGLRIHVLCYVVFNVVQVLVWWIFDSGNHFWPIWSIVAWGIGLLFLPWAAFTASRQQVYHCRQPRTNLGGSTRQARGDGTANSCREPCIELGGYGGHLGCEALAVYLTSLPSAAGQVGGEHLAGLATG
jgi:hypothetical protein